MYGVCGSPSSPYTRYWFENSAFTRRDHSLQMSNVFTEPPKSLQCTIMLDKIALSFLPNYVDF